jgi:hypothetical protein
MAKVERVLIVGGGMAGLSRSKKACTATNCFPYGSPYSQA